MSFWSDETLHRWRLPLLALGAVFLMLQVWSVFTAAMNWDETAMIERTVKYLRTGQLQGGGRPGLAELLVGPFAEGCRDVVSALRGARVVWVVITLAMLAGLYQVTRVALGALSSPRTYALFAVAALLGVPAFQDWSFQVRTDQPALALALWGGVALVASRQRPSRALLAGALVTLGALFSQKAIYIGALVGLLAAIELWLAEDASSRRWPAMAARILLAVAGTALILALYRFALPLFVEPPERTVTLQGGLSVFAYYRKAIGFSAYIAMLPTLVPFWIVGVFAVRAATTKSGSPAARKALAGSLAVLALGIAVGLFHAGAFHYFWMTLGLFPAVAAALALEAILASIPDRRSLRLAALLTVGVFLVQGLGAAALRLKDEQKVQREAFAFVERNIPEDHRGFQLRGELACRNDPEPFRTLFMQHVELYFRGPDADKHIDRMIEEFRTRPVTFMLNSQWLERFPTRLVDFWNDRFVPYHGAVNVQGRVVGGATTDVTEFEVLKAGRFRWVVDEHAAPTPLVINEAIELKPGEEVTLEAGVHRLALGDRSSRGRIVASLPTPPGESQEFF